MDRLICNVQGSKRVLLRSTKGNKPFQGVVRSSKRLTRAQRHDVITKAAAAAGSSAVLDVDVAIIGAGVIGLCTAREVLKQYPDLTVALVERKQLCAGATGAGQGYIWMAHRQPNTPGWELASRGKAAWESMLDEAVEDKSIAEAVEWQSTGSLLIGASAAEAEQLAQRQQLLASHGVASELLDSKQLSEAEPALKVGSESSALVCPGDAQISGRKAAAALLAGCTELGKKGRFVPLLDENVEALVITDTVPTIVTQNRRIRPRQGVVLAAGVWSGQLLSSTLSDPSWSSLLQPRRGFLVEIERPVDMPSLNHGMMEVSYTQHYSPGKAAADVAITFTATTSASGSLLVGSSREMGVWEAALKEEMVKAIMDRAATFLPGITSAAANNDTVRVGLRPFALGGLPMVGPVPDVPGLFLAAGHEGSGLCMAPATSQLLLSMMLRGGAVPGDDWSWASALLPAERKTKLAAN